MADDTTKVDKVKQVIDALKSAGHRLSDQDLADIQLKTDALRKAAAGDHEHHSDHSGVDLKSAAINPAIKTGQG